MALTILYDGDTLERREKTMAPKGFLFNAVACGIKKEDRLDLGLIFCPKGTTCAGVFTQNAVKAAPVLLGREIARTGRARGILVNSGCANACTGKAGEEDARTLLQALAKELGIETSELLPASTGVIGTRLPVEKMLPKLPALAQGLTPDRFLEVAQAMMTTDTFPKVVEHRLSLEGESACVLGLAKGAGMIAPNMATMLAFVLTDVQIAPADLQILLREAVSLSFNRITVDGDTSTNDTVYALASGTTGVVVSPERPIYQAFRKAFLAVCRELARLIVKDGEGAKKTVEIRVCGCRTEEKALILAKTVANSLLVKTALFGEDPNWGRILAAMGRSGVAFDPYGVDITIGKVKIVKDGLGLGAEAEKAAHEIMTQDAFEVLITLKEGDKEAAVLTCDLSYDYVRINAEYRT